MKTSCREYTSPRNEETSRVRGWIRGNTKTCPVLDVKVCDHQGRRPISFLGSHQKILLQALRTDVHLEG